MFDGNVIFGVQVMQQGTAATDRTGAYMRRITHGFARYRRQPEVYYSNGKALPGGEWALFVGRWIDNQRSDIYAAKLPPFPQPDGVDRSTFVGVPVAVPAAPLRADNAAVEFGYDASLRCTSRQETCVAASASIDQAKPFYWAGETFSGVECASGCTIPIPAISQRVIYYRVKYRSEGGRWRAGGETSVAASP